MLALRLSLPLGRPRAALLRGALCTRHNPRIPASRLGSPHLGLQCKGAQFRQGPGRPSSLEVAHRVVSASPTRLAVTLLPGEGAPPLDPAEN